MGGGGVQPYGLLDMVGDMGDTKDQIGFKALKGTATKEELAKADPFWQVVDKAGGMVEKIIKPAGQMIGVDTGDREERRSGKQGGGAGGGGDGGGGGGGGVSDAQLQMDLQNRQFAHEQRMQEMQQKGAEKKVVIGRNPHMKNKGLNGKLIGFRDTTDVPTQQAPPPENNLKKAMAHIDIKKPLVRVS
jgi:hypothetical protein